MKIQILVALLVAGFFTFCKKNKPEQTCTSCDTGPSTPPGFTFTKNGGSAITADSAYFYPSSNTIIAYYQGNTHRVNVKTASLNPGSYAISTTNKVTYTELSLVYNASGGSINITANANNKLSGDFTTSGTGGGFISVNGQFKDIPKR